MHSVRRPVSLAVLVGLSLAGCTSGDSAAPSPEPSSELAHECDPPPGSLGTLGSLPGGGAIQYTSTGLPTEEPSNGGVHRDNQGYWDPPMSENAFLLVGLPGDPAHTVPGDTVSSVTITTNGVNDEGVRADCLENVDATVKYVDTDYLPLWEVSIDEAFRMNTVATIEAPGVDGPIYVNPNDTLGIPYPDDGEPDSKPQFVADRIYESYFAAQ